MRKLKPGLLIVTTHGAYLPTYLRWSDSMKDSTTNHKLY